MSNPNKRKGSTFEQAVADYFTARGIRAERRVQRGRIDRGDIAGLDHLGVVIECKNLKSIDVAGAVDEARKEAANAGVPHGVAVIKRRNYGVHRAYAVVELSTLVDLLERSSA